MKMAGCSCCKTESLSLRNEIQKEMRKHERNVCELLLLELICGTRLPSNLLHYHFPAVWYLHLGYHSVVAMMKQFMDPVHGLIDIDEELINLIDTPQFQRLRNLSQLGTSYYVFAGATHKRFEHCIGTAHLAGMLLENIKKTQPQIDLSREETLLVKMAGLCHDLGHGPYSHAFDSFVHRIFPNTTWTHEQASTMMLDYLVDDNSIDLSPEHLKFLKEMIDPKTNPQTGSKRFLYDVISNTRNSLDVDKFDYLARDSHCLGLKGFHDSHRLISLARVVNDEICYPAKHAFSIYQLFHTRYSLHKTVYSHKVSNAIECMITDALVAADSFLGISRSLYNPEEYMHMTDAVVTQIESSKDPELETSRRILKDVRHRNLYKVAGEIVIKHSDGVRIGKIRPEDISTHQPAGGKLTPNDLIIHKFNMDYAMKTDNPVANVRFFNGTDLNNSFTMEKSQVSFMIPEMFSECVVRVFVRKATEQNMEWARKAFESFCAEKKLTKPGPVYSRPCTPKKSTYAPLLSPSACPTIPSSAKILDFSMLGEKRPRHS